MTPGSHARADEPVPSGPPPRRPWTAWRLGTPAVVLVCGALFVVSASNSEGTDLRPGRYTDLASLVEAESEQYAALEARVQQLDAEVEQLTETVDDTGVRRFQQRIEEIDDPAGLTPRSGPGVTVTLSDAPEDVINSSTRDLNLLIVHQQDIQAVVNAMWKGGATAVTIQGQRVVSTTGIKCQGNAVLLQGVPYPQPYVISAVGDQGELLEAIANDDYLEVYREQAAVPDISVGWEQEVEDWIQAPAFEGLLDLSYAEPLR
ncbi:DUF881 domain-containing protein [Nocardioides sp. GCM10027113]|uniref:DUF881 domain-containing protein n=1 Tax=unclassified Nocardioides TaxID=2615069 RepID=UPI003606178C